MRVLPLFLSCQHQGFSRSQASQARPAKGFLLALKLRFLNLLESAPTPTPQPWYSGGAASLRPRELKVQPASPGSCASNAPLRLTDECAQGRSPGKPSSLLDEPGPGEQSVALRGGQSEILPPTPWTVLAQSLCPYLTRQVR